MRPSAGRGRLLVAATDYHPFSVGAEARSAFNLVKALRSLGRRVVVLSERVPNVPDAFGLVRVTRTSPPYSGFVSPSHYAQFMVGCSRAMRRLSGKYDICQQVTPMMFRFPSPLAGSDKPFIWGPLGGSINYPPGFESYGSALNAVNVLRRLDGPRLRFDPLLRHTVSRAARIVVTSSQAAEVLPDRYRDKVINLGDAMPEDVVLSERPAESPYVFSSGRLIPYKAFDILIEAFAHVKRRFGRELRLIVTGDGSERASLEAQVRTLGLEGVVSFVGGVPRARNLELMRGAMLCAYPSLREGFGHVNLEAMGAWKPIVVTDWGGPRDIVVNEVTGIKVLGRNPGEHAQLFADAIIRLVEDSDLRARLGAAAADRVRTVYSWSNLAQRYEDLYASVLA